ncbi:hypothetical protein BGZ79_000261 [Entomortierella chlamydospora]|nr:hypothetical protein BGZ79_000261 [Entomortierella chlamydospora]
MITSKSQDIEVLAAGKGGWEVWAQCEIELVIKRRMEVVERSPKAFDTDEIGDLFYRPLSWSMDKGAVIELKCRGAETDYTFAQKLTNDAIKITGTPKLKYASCRFYSVGVMVGVPSVGLQTYTGPFGFAWHNVPNTDIWISYVVVDNA